MPPYPDVNLATALNGYNGYEITATDFSGMAGRTVTALGDINGDGYQDFAIGAPYASGSLNASGVVYVVFGAPGYTPPDFSTNYLNGYTGFTINGGSPGEHAGWSISGGGDLNGDGFDDIVIGAPDSGGYGQRVGAIYVVFGHAGTSDRTVELSTLNGSNGFKVVGEAVGDAVGSAVALGPDVNHDGVADLVIGAPGTDFAGTYAGSAYVVMGHTGAFAPVMNVSSADLRLDGAVGDHAGTILSAAGDFNGDGFEDLVIGAPGAGANAGSTYVVFGSAGASGTASLAALNGVDGFRLDGVYAGSGSKGAVASAGDVNGDGLDDIIVGAYWAGAGGYSQGAAYVIFGRTGVAPNLSASDLDGQIGFQIVGVTSGQSFGYAVSGAGDLNGDGFDDLIIGEGSIVDARATVILGHGGSFASVLTSGQIDGTNGYRIYGPSNEAAGVAVAGIGDINGDGSSDLLVGAVDKGPYLFSFVGGAYVIDSPAIPSDNFAGTSADETHSGGAGNDFLLGGGGKDILYGLGGSDILNGDDANDTLYGGDGADSLNGGLGNDILNGDAGNDTLDGGSGNDKLNGEAGIDHLDGGDGADWMDGGIGADVLNGGAGNDSLDGGAGPDAMTGGAGNDIYYVDDADDTTVELAGEGTDIVRASISWTLAANVEQLELQGTGNLDGTGNELANRLTGNSGDNVLSGMAGVDTILGGDGDDTIIGGTGNDLMTGGAGADTFVIKAESVYSSKAPAGGHLEIDFVYDLDAGEGDKLDLSAIDADINTAGDQAFSLVSAFTKHAGEMTLGYSASTGITVLTLDADGDGKADYQMKLTGDHHLDSGGWLL